MRNAQKRDRELEKYIIYCVVETKDMWNVPLGIKKEVADTHTP
jgi:hypothetical protein